MCSNFLNNDFEIFENETSDTNSDVLNDDHLFWGHDMLNSNDFNFDPLNENLYDNLTEKVKGRTMDFDYTLADFNDLLKEPSDSQHVKVEPTNSESSTYFTDESSHPSSVNSSPVSAKMRKRNYAALDSGSDKSFALYDEQPNQPAKASKVELIKNSFPTKIFKLTKDIKSEPIYINSVTIRQTNSCAPYIVHKLPSGVKTVNIVPQKCTTERPVELLNNINNNNFIHNTQKSAPEHDQDFLVGNLYDSEIDHFSDYRVRSNGYYQQPPYANISQSNINKNLFQPIPQVGPLHLTEEEKRTLLVEGYCIPTRLPLTKQDERNLKKVRRKIKNKISAQESRRKKKEYLDALEKKMESYEHERVENKRRIELLENTQRSLYNQIRHLQQQLMSKVTGSDNGTSTGLMLFMVCFALTIVGGSMSSSYNPMYNGPQSRLESSSSFYHMGYSTSRSFSNYSEQGNLFQDNLRYKLEGPNYQSFASDGIIPRQSILFDGNDDYNDINVDDFDRIYVKDRQMCEINIRHEAVVVKNGNDSRAGADIIVIDVMTSLTLVK